MGSKGSKQSWQPPADEPSVDTAAIASAFEGMAGMMGSMMEGYSQQMAAMQDSMMKGLKETGTPEVLTPPSVNWADKQKELAAQVKADYNLQNTRKKNTATSIYTSPLLDNEEAQTTNASLVAQR